MRTITRQHIRANARLWLLVIAPRIRVHLMVYLCALLTPKRDRCAK